jgi:hypothetical protein
MRGVDPVSLADAVRARVPDVLRTYQETRANVLESGTVDPGIKRLCARYLAGEEELASFEASGDLDETERVALAWAEAIAWNPEFADDALWESLQANFSEPELVELGYYMAIVLGQLHWLRTLDIEPRPEELISP